MSKASMGALSGPGGELTIPSCTRRTCRRLNHDISWLHGVMDHVFYGLLLGTYSVLGWEWDGVGEAGTRLMPATGESLRRLRE